MQIKCMLQFLDSLKILQNEVNSINLAKNFIDLYNNKKLQQNMIDEFTKLHYQLINFDVDGLKKSIVSLIDK